MDTPKILVAVDGSDQSFQAVEYVLEFFNPGQVELTLFHVFSKLPDACWDLEDHPGYRQTVAGMRAWAAAHKKEMEAFIEKVRQKAGKAGYKKNHIQVLMPERKTGIARDIAAQAKQGYQALVLGRTGVSRVKDFLLGSVADKLVGKLSGVPLWLIGGQPNPHRILVALDNSPDSMKALDYVGKMAQRPDIDVLLLNVHRGLSVFIKEYSEMAIDEWGGDDIKGAGDVELFNQMEKILVQARQRLVDAGIHENGIQVLIVKDVPSRAYSIVEKAGLGEYGTIVVGRRGLTRVQEFFMGRVSSKIMRLAKKQAVWVVG